MKLINSNKFKEKLNYLNYELYNSHPIGELSKEEKDTVSWYIYHINKMVDNMSMESAVPVEWIKKYIDNRLIKYGDTWTFINCMINEWEKKNG
jgi:hypothetical protein